MNTGYKEKLLKMKEKAQRSKGNRFLWGFIIVFIVGYAIFFTSKHWLAPVYVGVPTTKIGETVSQNDRDVTIKSWVWSKEQKKMEIIVSIDNLSIDDEDYYSWIVKDRNGRLKSKVVLEKPDFVVINVFGVKSDWTELALVMSLESGDRKKDNAFKPITVYASTDTVRSVDEIEDKSEYEYKRAAVEEIRMSYEKQIKALHSENQEKEKQIEAINEKIAELAAKKELEAESDAAVTQEKIDKLTDEKDTLQKEIDDAKAVIKDLNDKIRALFKD